MRKINREVVKHKFVEYVNQYDSSDEKIRLKIDHTYRVAALCQRIAQSLHLSSGDVDLAWLLGMLHDIGRFEQLKNYGTFSDENSIDHAHYGVTILFEQGHLREYIDIDPKDMEYALIRTAIDNHSAYRIESGMDERTEMFCHILRDSDKIDILKVNYDISIETIYNVTTEELKNAVVTPTVMEQFLEHHAILRTTKKSCVDHIVGHSALVFELVYPESLRIVEEQGYLHKILQFSSHNSKTVEQFAILRESMKSYLEEKRAEGDKWEIS